VAEDDGEHALRLIAALGWFWLVRGHLTEGRAQGALVLDRFPAMVSPAAAQARIAVALLAMWQADFAAADTLASAGERMARLVGDPSSLARSLLARTFLECLRQDFVAAVTVGEISLAVAREHQDVWCIAATFNALARAAHATGDLERADPLYQQGLALAEQSGDDHGAAAGLLCLGQIAAARGNLPEAARLAAATTRRYDLIGDTANLPHGLELLASVVMRLDAAIPAARLLGAAESLREATGITLRGGYARLAHDEVVAAARRALGESAYLAETGTGRITPLNEILAVADAVAASEEHGATRAAGPSLAAERGTGLTRREREVLHLLQEGRTDRQIAMALSISHDTARKHAANILAKLDVRTRTAAVTAALRRGLIDPLHDGETPGSHSR
jgi:DNA-binding NarL/FixJ family response regulator